MTATPNLEAYCARIGHDGARTATLETLHALQARHVASIPFEAIDVLLGRGVDLAPEAVEHKLVNAGRGGYCFEHNGLFKRVLIALGFHVEGLAARVRWMESGDGPAQPRSHMALRVTIDGRPWLVDVGFGAAVPTAPLRLDHHAPQALRHDTFRLQPVDDELLLQIWRNDDWRPVYQLGTQVQLDVDYKMANWYTATHPDSHFRRNLMLARTTPQARYALHNNQLSIRRPHGANERHGLTADELEQHLKTTFGLPVAAAWRCLIERAAHHGG